MEYILISIMTILIFTYIVYLLANKLFSLHMHIKYFLLCACCAIAISLILPRMFVGYAGLAATLGIVILFAMISSYFIAYYYDDGIKGMALEGGEGKHLIEPPVSDMLQPAAINNSALQLNQTAEEPDAISDNRESVNEDYLRLMQAFADLTTILKTNESEKLQNIPNQDKPVESLSPKEFYYPMKLEEEKPKVLLSTTENMDLITAPGILESCQDDIELASRELSTACEITLNTTINNAESEEKTTEEFQKPSDNGKDVLLPNINVEVISESTAEDCCLSLDELVDFAFMQKEQSNFDQALKAFRQGLLLYPNSEIAPLLVVEIGTILKNMGSYNEAIQVFTEGRLLPGVINNNMLEQEFINNIAYLRVVKNVLVKNALAFMPFHLIPEDAFKEIEAEFYEWRNQF